MSSVIKRFRVLIILIIFSISGCNGQNSIRNKVIDGFHKYYSGNYSGYLNISKIEKKLHSEDTVISIVDIMYTRQVNNSLRLEYNVMSKSEKGNKRNSFNGENLYILSDASQTITRYPESEEAKIMSNIQNNFKLLPVLNPEDYRNQILRKGKFFDENKYFLFKYKGIEIQFSKENYAILKIIEKGEYLGDVEFIEINISRQAYNIELPHDWLLNDQILPEGYAIIDYNKGNNPVNINVGTNLKFKGTSIQGELFDSEKIQGKAILLDFWFINCKPCTRSTPLLVEFSKKYNKDLLVVGINSIDKSKENILEYIQRNDMQYMQLHDYTMDLNRKFQVTNYPSFFLLNEHGELIKIFIGFDDDVKKDLTKTLSSLLD